MSSSTQPDTVDNPLIILPTSPHTHTIILLHGRGSNATRFAFDTTIPTKPGFLQSHASSGLTLPQTFPGMKFIFPTAPKRRCTAKKRTKLNIWFDNSSFEDPFAKEELQIDGLCENTAAVRELVLIEARTLCSLKKVFLGGISQGCAIGLHVLLSLDTIRSGLSGGLGGFLGMSGWLPFQNSLEDIVSPLADQDPEDGDDDDPFGLPDQNDQKNSSGESEGVRVAQFVREDIMGTIRCPEVGLCFPSTPILLGHGDQDDNVKLEHGESSMMVMKHLCEEVSWKVYEGQGHWYKVPEQIDDVVKFLKGNGC